MQVNTLKSKTSKGIRGKKLTLNPSKVENIPLLGHFKASSSNF
jgi:hypothetical protein